MNDVLAIVWLPNGLTESRPATPGRRLAFVGGRGEVRTESDMPAVLQMADARVQVSPDWQEWLPKWVSQVPGLAEDKVKARVEILDQDVLPVAEDPETYPAIAPHKAGCLCKRCAGIRASRRAKAQEPVLV